MDGRHACILLGALSWAALCHATIPTTTFGQNQTGIPRLTPRDIYTRQLEERAGQMLALRIEQPRSLLQDPTVSKYMNHEAQRILAKSGSDQHVTVKVLVSSKFNAFSVPGGRIYVTVGLLKSLASEDELAAVLAHEIAHTTAHDWVNQRTELLLLRRRQRTAWRGFPSRGFTGFRRARSSATIMAAWRRRAEVQADAQGLDYVCKAGYDPAAFVSLLKKASTLQEQNPLHPQVNVQNYRETAFRLALVEQRVRSLPAQKTHRHKHARAFVKMQRRLGVVKKR